LNAVSNKLQNKPLDRNLQVSIRVKYDKVKEETGIIYKQIYSSDYATTIRNTKNVADFITHFVDGLMSHIDEHESGPSGMIFEIFTSLQIHFTYRKLSKVGSYIELLSELKNKNCCVNIKEFFLYILIKKLS
jgi:hypothetical protein